MSKVLIPVDGSSHAEGAIKWYLKHAHKPGNEVILAHVSDDDFYPTFGYRATIPKEEWQAAFKESQQLLKSIEKKHTETLLGAGLDKKDIRFLSERGSPGSKLIEILHRTKADMVVMGSRGLGTIRRTLVGSTSSYVLHHANVPVCVCKEGAQDI